MLRVSAGGERVIRDAKAVNRSSSGEVWHVTDGITCAISISYGYIHLQVYCPDRQRQDTRKDLESSLAKVPVVQE